MKRECNINMEMSSVTAQQVIFIVTILLSGTNFLLEKRIFTNYKSVSAFIV